MRTLFVQEDLSGGGFRECPGEGEPAPVRDIADEAIEQALRQQARVVLVPGAPPC